MMHAAGFRDLVNIVIESVEIDQQRWRIKFLLAQSDSSVHRRHCSVHDWA